MTISIIIINYNSKHYLEKCLESLQQKLFSHPTRKYGYEVLVVNNESDPLQLTTPVSVPLRIMNNNANVGFGAANNFGADQAKGDLLFILNPDIQLPDASLEAMADYFLDNPEIGIIGPKIILSSEKRPQPWTCGKKTSLLRVLFKSTLGNPWESKETIAVEWVTGTALLIRQKDFNALGGFDENFFMYFEDQDLCLRMKALGKTVVFFPHSHIIHYDGKSWDNKKKQKTYFYRSQDYFFLKHYGTIRASLLKFLRLPALLIKK